MDELITTFNSPDTNNPVQMLYFPSIVKRLEFVKARNYYVSRQLKHQAYEYYNDFFHLYYDGVINESNLFIECGELCPDQFNVALTEFRLFQRIKHARRGFVPVNLVKLSQDMHYTLVQVRKRILCVEDNTNRSGYVIQEDYESDCNLKRQLCEANVSSIPQIAPLDNPVPTKLALSPTQQKVIEHITKNPVTCVTGGAGTGKTTIILRLIELMYNTPQQLYILCPTNMAAENIRQRAESISDIFIGTIHTFGGQFEYVPQDSIIVFEEASMYDNILSEVLKHNSQNSRRCRYVFIGDPNQLPPVQRSSVFNVVIELFRCVRDGVIHLTENYRSQDLIIQNAYRILNATHDVPFQITEGTNYSVRSIFSCMSLDLHQLVIDNLTGDLTPDDIMFITHRNRDVIALNFQLREIINSLADPDYYPPTDPNEYFICALQNDKNSYGVWEWRVGDKCICRRTVSRRDRVYNGNIGVVRGINRETRTFEVYFPHIDDTISVSSYAIWPAYCITVHNSQGQEWPICVFCDMSGKPISRPLMYVACTRAKNKQIIYRVQKDDSEMLGRCSFVVQDEGDEVDD
jgi:exodeoxyribonuclease V alpha subunit